MTVAPNCAVIVDTVNIPWLGKWSIINANASFIGVARSRVARVSKRNWSLNADRQPGIENNGRCVYKPNKELVNGEVAVQQW